MSTPSSPGWYSAPDGNGEQWWNGSAWSESKRNSDGTVPGLPGYQAAPPRDGAIPLLMPPPPTTSAVARAAGTDGAGIMAIVFGIVGLTVFSLFAPFAIIAGIATFKSTSWVGRILSLIGIGLGVLGIVFAIVAFAQSGFSDWGNLIF
jgi:hypothetical protein